MARRERRPGIAATPPRRKPFCTRGVRAKLEREGAVRARDLERLLERRFDGVRRGTLGREEPPAQRPQLRFVPVRTRRATELDALVDRGHTLGKPSELQTGGAESGEYGRRVHQHTQAPKLRQGQLELRHRRGRLATPDVDGTGDAASVRGLDTLGVQAGLATPVDGLGIFGRLITRASTLEHGIETLIRAAPGFDSGGRYWLTRDGDRTWLCHQFRDGLAATSRQADQYWLMVALNVVRLAAGSSWCPDELRCESPRPRESRDLDHLLGIPVAFERDESAVGFPTPLLGRPLVPPRTSRPVDVDDVERWTATAPAGEFAQSIVQVVVTLTSSGLSHIDVVAHAIGTSVRTLQRRLGDAGTSYTQVLARARFRTAAHLLSSSDATVLDVALDVGYSDPAHFARAFQRWTGCSPSAYRQANRNRCDAALVCRGRWVPRSNPWEDSCPRC
jgi:AraC-like DNA-binding protein